MGDEYRYLNWEGNWISWQVKQVDWKWFACTHTKKCIHFNNRCDSHPHPDCIYKNDHGLLVSEDEEDCPSRRFFYNVRFCYFKTFLTRPSSAELGSSTR